MLNTIYYEKDRFAKQYKILKLCENDTAIFEQE